MKQDICCMFRLATRSALPGIHLAAPERSHDYNWLRRLPPFPYSHLFQSVQALNRRIRGKIQLPCRSAAGERPSSSTERTVTSAPRRSMTTEEMAKRPGISNPDGAGSPVVGDYQRYARGAAAEDISRRTAGTVEECGRSPRGKTRPSQR